MITVVIPTIPPRAEMLERALRSVWGQQRPADLIVISVDSGKHGAAVNRQRGLDAVQTEYVAFLDDDDMLYPEHLRLLEESIIQRNSDLVYPWFDVDSGQDPFPMFEGRAWDDADPHQVPITFLARTQAVRDAGGFADFCDTGETDVLGNRAGEDYRLILRMVSNGAKIEHLDARTWRWFHHGRNTSGLPSRW